MTYIPTAPAPQIFGASDDLLHQLQKKIWSWSSPKQPLSMCVLLCEELECMQNMTLFICVPKPECYVQLCFMVNLNVVQVENLNGYFCVPKPENLNMVHVSYTGLYAEHIYNEYST
jgi:hypothetical protein